MMPGASNPTWIYVYSKNCPFCIKQHQQLQGASPSLKENLKMVDKDNPQAMKQMNLINFSGVPHFQNMKTGETMTGLKPLSELEQKIGSKSKKKWKNTMQTERGRDARTFIWRGQKHGWDTSKYPI
jgi:hypothetical protein